MKPSLHLKIPASTANLGGFDSIGMAINKYLYLYVEEAEGSNWEFKYLNEELDSYRKIKNYVHKVAQQVAEKYNVTLPNLKVSMRSEIPLARGLDHLHPL